VHTPPIARFPALALTFAFGIAACNPFGKQDASASSSPASTPNVQLGPAARQESTADRIRVRTERPVVDTISSILETTCHVEAIREAEIYPKTGGVIREVLVEEGEMVKEGQVLAVIDQAEAKIQLKQAEIAVEESRRSVEESELALEESRKKETQAKTDADQARRDYERDKKLSSEQDESGLRIVAPKVLEASKLAWERADNTYQLAQFSIRRAELAVAAAKTNLTKSEWSCELARVRLTDTEIRTPFSGVVSMRGIKLGETATPQTKAFKITDLDRLQMVFYRPQRDLRVLATGGQPVTATSEAITIDPYTNELRVFSGVVERVSPVVDPASGSFKITASLDNSQRLLRPGLLVRVRVTLGRRDQAFLIPKRARVLEGEKPFVFVVRAGITVKIPIEEGFSDADRIEVRNISKDAGAAEGLRPDDMVVVVANVDLKEGLKVTPEAGGPTGG
jgi:membrane fusion protein (multidrug efflux system)